MDWSRGLFRAWLVAAILWVLGTGVLAVGAMINTADGAMRLRDLREGLVMMCVPPFGLLGIGALALWAAKGFRST